MNIAQSFEKLRYGLYLEPLGLSLNGKGITERIKYGWNSNNAIYAIALSRPFQTRCSLISFDFILGTNVELISG